ncbi:MAG: 30S ribosomal protein S12 methylthiotransferase RimO, partial [Candidatus Nanopelagicales bacterium]
YSNEDDTEAALMSEQISEREIAERFIAVSQMVEEISQQRSESRVGEIIEVLFDTTSNEGRNQYQAPEVDGITLVDREIDAGIILKARVIGAHGVDLIAEIL